jgi:hypothetical protein
VNVRAGAEEAGSLVGLSDLSPTVRRAFLVALVLLVVATGAILVVTDGNIAAAIGAPLAVVFAYVLMRLPAGALAPLFILGCLLVDNPTEGPGMGLFKTPLLVPGNFVYLALEKTLGVPGLKIFGIEVLLVGLIIVRVLTRGRPEERALPGPPKPFVYACLATVGTVLFLEVYGIVRGGDTRMSMLMFRPLLLIGIIPLVYAYCARSSRQVPILLGGLVVVAFTRAAFGIYAWATVLKFGIRGTTDLGGGAYVMTHSDAIFGATAMSILVTWVIMQPSMRSMAALSTFGVVILFGMVINNRRITFVSLVAGLALLWIIGDPLFKARVTRLFRLALPFLLIYLVVGWRIDNAVTRPVQMLKSVFEQKDASSQTRDIENFNLLYTAKQAPILGSGFGHEYLEKVVAYDISHAFEAYRYVPHNSILWLFSAGGFVGYTGFFMLMFVGLYYAMRLLRKSPPLSERLLAMSTVTSSIAYGMQAWGDMGLGSYMGGLIVCAHFGLVASIAGLRRVDALDVPQQEAARLQFDVSVDEPRTTLVRHSSSSGGARHAT